MATGALVPIFSSMIPKNDGTPNAGGLCHFYVAGTVTPQAIYKDSSLLTAHENPMTLDSSGRAPSDGVYFQAKSYKVRIEDSLSSLLWEQDNWQDFGQVQGVQAQSFAARSQVFNIDNGGGTTIDDVIMQISRALTLTSAKIVYVEEVTGTVAAGSVQLATTVGGDDIALAQNYENGKAIGAVTPLTLAATALAANQALHVRHIGVAATQAGKAYVEVEFA
jgi:hypothetical protein